MQVTWFAAIALIAALCAAPAYADPIRLSVKMTCNSVKGPNPAISKQALSEDGFVAVARNVSIDAAKVFDIAYFGSTQEIWIVTRCDGQQIETLATTAGATVLTGAGPNGVTKFAMTSLMVPANWNGISTEGALNCRFVGKQMGDTLTSLSGTCKGPVLYGDGNFCDLQFSTAGAFVPKGVCPVQ